jgi:Na+-translocating ferredoxin:NAD+ oxidoreductase RnfE subunit
MSKYIYLFQVILIVLKAFAVIAWSWWIVFLPLIILNGIVFVYSFCKAFKREFNKAKL